MQRENTVCFHITDAECGDKGTAGQLKESKCTSQVSQMFKILCLHFNFRLSIMKIMWGVDDISLVIKLLWCDSQFLRGVRLKNEATKGLQENTQLSLIIKYI